MQGKEDQGRGQHRGGRNFTLEIAVLRTRFSQQDTKEYLNQRGTQSGVFQESKKGG